MEEVITHIYVRRTLWMAKRYDWRSVHSNGNIVATSGGQGYANCAECIDMAKKYGPHGSQIVDEKDWPIR